MEFTYVITQHGKEIAQGEYRQADGIYAFIHEVVQPTCHGIDAEVRIVDLKFGAAHDALIRFESDLCRVIWKWGRHICAVLPDGRFGGIFDGAHPFVNQPVLVKGSVWVYGAPPYRSNAPEVQRAYAGAVHCLGYYAPRALVRLEGGELAEVHRAYLSGA